MLSVFRRINKKANACISFEEFLAFVCPPEFSFSKIVKVYERYLNDEEAKCEQKPSRNASTRSLIKQNEKSLKNSRCTSRSTTPKVMKEKHEDISAEPRTYDRTDRSKSRTKLKSKVKPQIKFTRVTKADPIGNEESRHTDHKLMIEQRYQRLVNEPIVPIKSCKGKENIPVSQKKSRSKKAKPTCQPEKHSENVDQLATLSRTMTDRTVLTRPLSRPSVPLSEISITYSKTSHRLLTEIPTNNESLKLSNLEEPNYTIVDSRILRSETECSREQSRRRSHIRSQARRDAEREVKAEIRGDGQAVLEYPTKISTVVRSISPLRDTIPFTRIEHPMNCIKPLQYNASHRIIPAKPEPKRLQQSISQHANLGSQHATVDPELKIRHSVVGKIPAAHDSALALQRDGKDVSRDRQGRNDGRESFKSRRDLMDTSECKREAELAECPSAVAVKLKWAEDEKDTVTHRSPMKGSPQKVGQCNNELTKLFQGVEMSGKVKIPSQHLYSRRSDVIDRETPHQCTTFQAITSRRDEIVPLIDCDTFECKDWANVDRLNLSNVTSPMETRRKDLGKNIDSPVTEELLPENEEETPPSNHRDLSFNEMKVSLNLQQETPKFDITVKEALTNVKEADLAHFREVIKKIIVFYEGIEEFKIELFSLPNVDIFGRFASFDKENKGYLSLSEFWRLLKLFGIDINEEQLILYLKLILKKQFISSDSRFTEADLARCFAPLDDKGLPQLAHTPRLNPFEANTAREINTSEAKEQNSAQPVPEEACTRMDDIVKLQISMHQEIAIDVKEINYLARKSLFKALTNQEERPLLAPDLCSFMRRHSSQFKDEDLVYVFREFNSKIPRVVDETEFLMFFKLYSTVV
jgi:hypothetical protein